MYLLSRPYYVTRFSYPVWLYIVNRKGHKLYRAYRIPLNEVQRRIAHDISQNGYAVTHTQELFSDRPELFSELKNYMEKSLLPFAQQKKGKTYLRQLIKSDSFIDLKNPFMRLMLEQRVLEIVNAYFEVFARLRTLELCVAEVKKPGAHPVRSQCWHRDPEDKKMCKMFLYLNDVDETTGPLWYVEGSQYGGRHRNIFPQQVPAGYYPPEGAVETHVPKKDIKPLTGRAGTIIFADTSGLHKGGYSTEKERIMFTVCYKTDASSWPAWPRHPENAKEQYEVLNLLARHALYH